MNNKNLNILFGVLITISIFSQSGHAGPHSSPNYIIQVNVIDAGGNDGSSTNYNLLYSVGQPSIIGDLVSTNYLIYAGYFNALSGVADGGQFSPYDTDQDGSIGDFELLDAIEDWVEELLGNFELLHLIDFWAYGCYHWDASLAKNIAGCP